MNRFVLSLLFVWSFMDSAFLADAAVLIGPTPYLSSADSPFDGSTMSYFFLETFEDGVLNVPGVTASAGVPRGPGPNTDSVDGDDGSIDGSGTSGWDFATSGTGSGDLGISFAFDEVALGGLPTHVGIVWTDGGFSDPTSFEAFDRLGSSLGVIGPVDISDNSFAGETDEDRFFGVIELSGVSRITIWNPGSSDSIQVDHLQYGAIPEPTSLALLALGSLAAFRRR